MILLPWNLVIFFLDGYDFILKSSILVNVPFILRHEGHKMKLKIMTPRQVSKNQHRLKEKIEIKRIKEEELKTAEGRGNEEKKLK